MGCHAGGFCQSGLGAAGAAATLSRSGVSGITSFREGNE